MNPYGIYNVTLKKWIKDENGNDYWEYDYSRAENTKEWLQLIDEAGFLSGAKKLQSELEVREQKHFTL